MTVRKRNPPGYRARRIRRLYNAAGRSMAIRRACDQVLAWACEDAAKWVASAAWPRTILGEPA